MAFRLFAALRRGAYRVGLLPREQMAVPVVIVGNITVGGSGKTPLVIYLAHALRALGRHPGVVSRGFRRTDAGVARVTLDSDVGAVGDEALLLARQTRCPVFVGRSRPAAVRTLLAAHPECDVILSDDGLQHYRLARDLEIAVFDRRGAMNGWCLPAGPLREPLSRLEFVDALVLNDTAVSPSPSSDCPVFLMRLQGDRFRRLDDAQVECRASDLAGRTLHAVAGIGSPQRFFDRLRELGLSFAAHPFADHHAYSASDLAFAGDAILTTEKDAVKLERLELCLPVWVLPVTAQLSPDLAEFVLEKLNGCPPA